MRQAAGNNDLTFTDELVTGKHTVYKGFLNKEGKQHGPGLQYWADGARYEGEWHSGQPSGRGKLIHADGSAHQGEW